jgi:two-component sensor histidine kinase
LEALNAAPKMETIIATMLCGIDGRVVLRWTEAGGPPATPPARRGFGTRVMERMIQLMKGDMRFDWRAEGLACEVAIPT